MRAIKQAIEVLTGKLLIIGIGNSIRGDDAAGPEIVKKLAGKTSALLIDGGETPERELSRIIKLGPDAIIILDAADFGKPAGHTAIVAEADISDASFSTHRMPLSLLIHFIKSELKQVKILIIGIQPESMNFGNRLSAPVKKSVAALVKILADK